MRNKFIIRCAAICMALLMTLTPANASAATLLKRGSSGTVVKTIQATLKDLGYFTYSATGYYGSLTEAAVKRFQRDNHILADGIIGNKTKGILLSNASVKPAVKTTTAVSAATVVSGSALTAQTINTSSEYCGDLDWFKQVRDIWQRGMDATVTDVNTGKSFQVMRTYGTNHADVEPLTTEDTATIKAIWGGFSWERRAVIVQIGDYTIAGSMTAMPHAGVDSKPANVFVSNRSAGYGFGINLDTIKNNGVSGHMDIHFKNSRTHGTNIVQKSQQDMVKKAASYINNLLLQ
ncbi:MAG TPA: peptidoglycan-binding domain-containing protein [Mobilitalea sp.]|nr:peptidoglycan-binding domain-containing protein [Mobilitalea sp.]